MYLCGDSAVHLSLESLCSVTVQELGRSVREALHVPESLHDAFAFWLCSPLLGKVFFLLTLFYFTVYTLEIIKLIDDPFPCCRAAVESEASAVQTMSSVEGLVVSLH